MSNIGCNFVVVIDLECSWDFFFLTFRFGVAPTVQAYNGVWSAAQLHWVCQLHVKINFAYGRHRISQGVRVGGQIQLLFNLKKLPGLRFQVSGVRCHVLCVTCCMSPVTCHMSLTQTATATDPPPANSPSMHSRMLLLILTYTHKKLVGAFRQFLSQSHKSWDQCPSITLP